MKNPMVRGHTLVIQAVIVLVVAGVLALPIYFLVRSKVAQKHRLLDAIVALVNESNRLRTKLTEAFDRIGRSGSRLPHAEGLKREYGAEFSALFRRYFEAQKGVDAGESKPGIADLAALQRDFEDYRRRVGAQYARIKALLDLIDLAECAVTLARHYQGGIRTVRDAAPFRRNESILPQLEEADRQLGTAMSFVLTGIQKFQEDLRGRDTPILIKTGIEQVRRITTDVDRLFGRIEGADTARVESPEVGRLTLAEYLRRFAAESAKGRIPPLPERRGPAPGTRPNRMARSSR